MPMKIICIGENNPDSSSRNQMDDKKRKNNIYRNEIAEQFVNSGIKSNQTIGSAQTPCFMATPNQTDEGWNQQATVPTQKIS
jgi:hypothetical protein